MDEDDISNASVIKDIDNSSDESVAGDKEKHEPRPAIQAPFPAPIKRRPIKRPFLLDEDDISDDGDKEIIAPPVKKKSKQSKSSRLKELPVQEETKRAKDKSSKEKIDKTSEAVSSRKHEKKKKGKKKLDLASSSPVKKPAHFEASAELESTEHHTTTKKSEAKDKPVHRSPVETTAKPKSSSKNSTPSKPQKRSGELIKQSDKSPTKKLKKSNKVSSLPPADTQASKGHKMNKGVTRPSVKPSKSKTGPPPTMDWFSAVLASEVQKKQVSRKPTVKPPEHGRTKDSSSTSVPQSKDVVLAAKFPHKRKHVPASDVLSTSHPKRPTGANRAHKKPLI